MLALVKWCANLECLNVSYYENKYQILDVTHSKVRFVFLHLNSDINHLTLSECLPDKPKHITSNESLTACGREYEAVSIMCRYFQLFSFKHSTLMLVGEMCVGGVHLGLKL